MPATMSVERRKLLTVYGAKLVLTEGPRGMSGAVAKAEEIAASDPDRYVLLQQFKNPANAAIHEDHHGPGDLGRHRRRGRHLRVGRRHRRHHHGRVAPHQADPRQGGPLGGRGARGQPRAHAAPRGRAAQARPHKIQGIGAGFVPDVLDLSLVDAWSR
jgi:cysteine synthase A